MKLNNLAQRIISGVFIGLVAIFSIYSKSYAFYIMIAFISVMCFVEWFNLNKKTRSFNVKSFMTNHMLLGAALILPSMLSLVLLKKMTIDSPILLAVYFISIWSTDIFAYFGGKLIKGPKAFPKMSPNKTASGFLVGIIFAGMNSFLFIDLMSKSEDIKCKVSAIATGVLIGMVSQYSDVLMSSFKRRFGVKDFGGILPGHGGVLDRFDSVILSAPLFLILLTCT